jgi:hypothetical protein
VLEFSFSFHILNVTFRVRYVTHVNITAHTSDLVAGRIVATFDMRVMLYILVHLKFTAVDNSNMAGARSCDTGATLAPLVVRSQNNIYLNLTDLWKI